MSDTQQEEVFAFIVFYKEEHDGNSPTASEIKHGCETVKTAVPIMDILNELEKKGKIRLRFVYDITERRMNIEVVGGKWRLY